MPSIVCSKCGESKLAGKHRYQKLVDKAGSEENMKSTYLCRDCRKGAKPVKTTTPAETPAEEPVETDTDSND